MARSTAPLYVGTLYFEAGIAGWSEKYYMDADSRTGAINQLTLLANARKNIMPFNIKLAYARVSQAGNPRDGNAVDAIMGMGNWGSGLATMQAPPAADVIASHVNCDFPSTALFCRQEGVAGGWLTRYYRGIPDSKVNGLTALVGTGIWTRAEEPPAIGATDSTQAVDWSNCLRRFMVIVAQTTIHVSGKLGQDGGYEWQRTQKIIFRKVGSRKVGRPFNLYHGRA